MTYWKTKHQNKAYGEGWGIFDNSDHGPRIERTDERFYSDAAAQTWVAFQAMNGSTLHVLAVNFLYDELCCLRPVPTRQGHCASSGTYE